MIVYSRNERARTAPLQTLFVAPAADIDGEAPSEWMTSDGSPATLAVEFRFGRAEVPGNLGDYLIRRGYAARTSLIVPPALLAA